MLLEIIIASIIFALLITLVFGLVFHNRGPWGMGLFFVVLFLMMWASGLWLNPVGPYFFGVSWIPLLFVGLLTAFLLSGSQHSKKKTENKASNPPNPRGEDQKDVVAVSDQQQRDAVAMSVFFWAMIVALIVAIAAGYIIK